MTDCGRVVDGRFRPGGVAGLLTAAPRSAQDDTVCNALLGNGRRHGLLYTT